MAGLIDSGGVGMSHFAHTIFQNKYAHICPASGRKETWPETAERVARCVVGPYLPDMVPKISRMIKERKLMPGGRYLYAAGRRFPQLSSCFLMRAEDSRQGWGNLCDRAANALMTGGGVGVVYSGIRSYGLETKGMGGIATGPCSLMGIINEQGRRIMQGGSRRCLPVGTLVHTHGGLIPIEKVKAGDWALTFDGYHEVTGNVNQGVQQTVKVQTQLGPLECTGNHRVAVLARTDGEYYWKEASQLVEGDRLLFIPQEIPGHPTKLPGFSYPFSKFSSTCKDITIPELDSGVAWMLGFLHGNGYVHVYQDVAKGYVTFAVSHDNPEARDRVVTQLERFGVNVTVDQGDGACWAVRAVSRQLACYFAAEFKTPSTSINIPECILQGTSSVRRAYVAGVLDSDGCVKTRPLEAATSVYPDFLRQLQSVIASLGIPTRVKLSRPARGEWKELYSLAVCGPKQVAKFCKKIGQFSTKSAALSELTTQKKGQMGYTLPPEMMSAEKRWNGVTPMHKNRLAAVSLETYEKGFGAVKYVPITVKAVETGRMVETYDIEVEGRNEFVAAGGLLVHNSALWSGVHWWHPDIPKFITIKDWIPEVRALKERDFNFPAEMDMTNISVILDDDFFSAYHTPGWSKTYSKWGATWTMTHDDARRIYWECVRGMVSTGEPGFSIDIGEHAGEELRNPCAEAVSRDDGDTCNLASLNLARIGSREEFEEVLEAGVTLLLCGTMYGKLPMEEMYAVREKNRRIGLGLMGLHEWLLMRGHRYGPNDELATWLASYSESGVVANGLADRFGIARPIATRSVAPTGTLAIVAETTSGIEPIYATAYKRRFLDGKEWKAQNVVDPSAQRIVERGVNPEEIEDAVVLAGDVTRRFEFQAWLQSRTDQAIASTTNLPHWGSELNNEGTVEKYGETLLSYLPSLRGITAYPDGARGGQPITKMDYHEAVASAGVEYIDGGEHVCRNGVCGS